MLLQRLKLVTDVHQKPSPGQLQAKRLAVRAMEVSSS
jgi:hypothetical protein